MPLSYKQSEFLVERPQHATNSQIVEEKQIKHRLKGGLSASFEDVKQHRESPSLAYVENPELKT